MNTHEEHDDSTTQPPFLYLRYATQERVRVEAMHTASESLSPPSGHSTSVRGKPFVGGHGQSSGGFFTTFYLPISGAHGRRFRIYAPIPPTLYHKAVSRFGRRRGCLIILLGVVMTLWVVFAVVVRFANEEKDWPWPFRTRSTLVFQHEDLRKIWEWEIASGHYPSRERSEFHFLNSCYSYDEYSSRSNNYLSR